MFYTINQPLSLWNQELIHKMPVHEGPLDVDERMKWKIVYEKFFWQPDQNLILAETFPHKPYPYTLQGNNEDKLHTFLEIPLEQILLLWAHQMFFYEKTAGLHSLTVFLSMILTLESSLDKPLCHTCDIPLQNNKILNLSSWIYTELSKILSAVLADFSLLTLWWSKI